MSAYSNYESLKKYLESGKNKLERPSPYTRKDKVRVIDFKDYIGIKYHNTVILKFWPGNAITMFMGGWNTITTRTHMNEFLSGIRIWTKDRNAFVTIGGWESGNTYEFVEGMQVDPNGKGYDHRGKELPIHDPNREKELRKRDREIAKFADGFINLLKNRELPQPDTGDCFYCQFNLSGNPPISTLHEDGTVTPGMADQSDHIKSHMEEKYYVPSLLMAAFKMYEGQFSPYDKTQLGYMWKMNEAKPWSGRLDKYTLNRIKKAIINYVRHCLGLGVNMGYKQSEGF